MMEKKIKNKVVTLNLKMIQTQKLKINKKIKIKKKNRIQKPNKKVQQSKILQKKNNCILKIKNI